MEIIKKIIIRNKILLFLIGLFYGFILWIGGIPMGGAGHGTSIFVYIPFSPFTAVNPDSIYVLIAIIFWPLVALCTSSHILRYISSALLILHYIGIPKIIISEHRQYISLIWEMLPLLIIVWILFYLVGQIYFWLCIFHNKK